MKMVSKRKIYWILCGVLIFVILMTCIDPRATFLILFGYRYNSCGKIPVSDCNNIRDNQKGQEVNLYKARGKPFILVGPYTFSPGCQDFFFVNKNQVIRTATDKGGGAFFQLGAWLFVIDDMSGSCQKRVRAPWWDELKHKDSSVVKKNDHYIYTLFLEDAKKIVTFAIPEKILNSDLAPGAVL